MRKYEKCHFLRLAIILVGIALFASCHHGRPCFHAVPGITKKVDPEPFGPTDINAASGNMRLAVGFNSKGTVTLFKWPNPSYFDHIRFMTESRDMPLLGAFPNEGAFAGIYWETEDGNGFSWLRGDAFRSEQFYNSDDSDCVVTRFESAKLGLVVHQFDLVLAEKDVLVRHYRIRRLAKSPLRAVKLIHFANFHPVVTKYPWAPLRDWCLECIGNSRVSYHAAADALVYFEKGRDFSTRKKTSVAIALGTYPPSNGHQAGMDSYISKFHVRPADPFVEARKGVLSGSGEAKGEVTAGLLQDVLFDDDGIFEGSLVISAANKVERALQLVEETRAVRFEEQVTAKRKFWWNFLSKAPMPATDNRRIVQVAKRSLISILQGTCESGAIVASIATQAPYGEDWPRDGAFINVALEMANMGELVEKHNRFYARVQSRRGQKIWLVSKGNWAAIYYADAEHGMPIPYEIDETGFTLWTLWDHYEVSGNLDYLKDVFPAIEAGADFLVKHRDPKTGLHKKSWEDDIPNRRQTVHGAVPVYAGLRAAARAAEVLGRTGQARRWSVRASEIHRAIMDNLFDPACNCFVPGTAPQWDDAWAIYPGKLFPYRHPVMQGCADSLWKKLEASIKLKRPQGWSSYEPKALLSLALVWKGDEEKIKRVQEAVRWQAQVPITDTGHFGECWVIRGGKVTPVRDIPHIWHHALFYAAALEAFGRE